MKKDGKNLRSTITLNELRRILIERVLASNLSRENKIKLGKMIIDVFQEKKVLKR
jgi:hypothetical protein